MSLLVHFLRKWVNFYKKINNTVYLTSLPAQVIENYPIRTSQENNLYRILCRKNRHILLYGPGGTGKTHMARKLFYRLSNKYERLAWVEYGSDLRTSILAAFSEFDDVTDSDLRFSKIIRKLAEKPDSTILFIDDVRKDATNDDLLTRITGLGITVFITSRCKEMPPYTSYSIADVSTAECVNLFYANYPKDPKRKHAKTVWKLVDLLDCNVFATLLLSRVIGTEKDLEAYSKRLHGEIYTTTRSLAKPLDQLINISKLSANDKRILQCFSLMPSGETPLDIYKWFDFSKDRLDVLAEKGWLEKNTVQSAYMLHDLIREHFQSSNLPERLTVRFMQYVTQETFFADSDSREMFQYKLTCVNRILERTSKRIPFYAETALLIGDIYEREDRYAKSLTYYIMALESAKLQPEINNSLLFTIYFSLGLAYDNNNSFAEALNCYRQAEKYLNSAGTPDPYDVIALQNNIGVAYHNQADYTNALRYYENALKLRTQMPNSTHPNVAQYYNNIGNLYCDIGEYNKAIEYHNNALNILINHFGDMHAHTAISYNNMGNCYINIGDYNKALELYQKALNIKKSSLGSRHLDTADSLGNIGNVYYASGDYKKALELYQQALDIQEQILGSSHLTTGISYNNIGNVYCDLGDYSNALKYYHKSMDIREQLLGFKHPETAKCYINIGVVFGEMGDNVNALEYLHKAIAIIKSTLGEFHPYTANCYCCLGNIYYDTEEYANALEYYEQALSIMEKVFVSDHPEVACIYNNIGEVLFMTKDFTKALEFHQKALQIQTHHPSNLLNLAESYDNLSVVYCSIGNLEKAKEFVEQALSLRKERLPQNHPDISKTLLHLGNVHAEYGNQNEALQNWVESLTISEKTLGVSHPQTAKIKQILQNRFNEWFPLQSFDSWLQQQEPPY